MNKIIYKVAFTVNGENHGFLYHFDNHLLDKDLKFLVLNAIKEYIHDSKLNGNAEEIECILLDTPNTCIDGTL